MDAKRDSQSFLAGLRTKYPQYDKIDDETLMSQIKTKYPQYNDVASNSLPNPENFLQKAIKNSRIGNFGGTSITAALPADGAEAMDLGKVGIRQIIPDEAGLVGMGAKMAGVKGDIKLPAPETQYGKNLENSANIAQVAHLGGSLASSAGEGIQGLINKFRTTPTKQAIEDLIFQGGNKVKGAVGEMFKSSNAKFGEGIKNIESTMTADDFADIVAKTADELGTYDKSSQTLTREFESLINEGDKPYNVQDIQSKSKRVKQLLVNDERAKAIFNKHFLDKLPEGAPGLAELKAEHAPIYKTAQESKKLNTGAMRKLSKGNMGPQELSSLKETQSKLGVDVLGPIEQKGNELQKIIKRQKIAKWSLGLTSAGGTVLGALHAFGKKN